MPLDPVKNFAKVTASTGYDDNDVSITLLSGHGALLPDPASDGDFNITWYNASDYQDPSDDPNKEIVRVTARSGDVLTITRAQENTLASSHNATGKTYKFILGITKKMIDDINSQLGSVSYAFAENETPSGSINGSNTSFSLAHIPISDDSVFLFRNGVLQIKGVNYMITGANITATSAPQTGNTYRVWYRYAV